MFRRGGCGIVCRWRPGTIAQLNRCAVDKVDVRPAVVVEIKDRYTTLKRFKYVLFFCASGGQVKLNIRRLCHIHELARDFGGCTGTGPFAPAV